MRDPSSSRLKRIKRLNAFILQGALVRSYRFAMIMRPGRPRDLGMTRSTMTRNDDSATMKLLTPLC